MGGRQRGGEGHVSLDSETFGATRAPEIDLPGLAWFNVAAPLGLGQLRGKLVVLDFWTLCCVNCLHVLPALRRLEEAHPEDLVVIGVHSPKFAAERDPKRLQQAIARYGIRHPVLHDPERLLWQAYAVRAWPTLVFISPEGRVIGQHAGEPDAARLLAVVGEMIEDWHTTGLTTPAPLEPVAPAEAGGRFRFPGKIKPVPGEPRLWALADAGHHQIVTLNDNGREIIRYGSGTAGFTDGAPSAATFHDPQGLICQADAIFVADTGNHALRRIDLVSGQVSTIAGTGRRGGILLSDPAPARATALASPWDLERIGRQLYVANAGSHQIAAVDLDSETVTAVAGNGQENLVDGPGRTAQLAQPSGLARDSAGKRLFFADSETSSVRVLDLQAAPRVETLVGAGLFDFGQVDGPFEEARLQHALGLALAGESTVLVADSYNGALRRLDLENRMVSELDAGYDCADPLCLPLDEPAGIWAEGAERLLVVDTNNHRVLEYLPAALSYRTWSS